MIFHIEFNIFAKAHVPPFFKFPYAGQLGTMAQASNAQQRQEVERALWEVDQGAHTLSLKFVTNFFFSFNK